MTHVLTTRGSLGTETDAHRRHLHADRGKGQGDMSSWDASDGQDHQKLGKAWSTLSLTASEGPAFPHPDPGLLTSRPGKKITYCGLSQTRSPWTLLHPPLLKRDATCFPEPHDRARSQPKTQDTLVSMGTTVPFQVLLDRGRETNFFCHFQTENGKVAKRISNFD